VTINGGKKKVVSGASCSSPIVASIIALLNAELIAAGNRPLGFLNPFIYANPKAFNDITTGSNPGCNTNGFPVRACMISFIPKLRQSLPGQARLGSGKSNNFICSSSHSLL
jgi:subtilase family serine protease